jgi:hypothetical protein
LKPLYYVTVQFNWILFFYDFFYLRELGYFSL